MGQQRMACLCEVKGVIELGPAWLKGWPKGKESASLRNAGWLAWYNFLKCLLPTGIEEKEVLGVAILPSCKHFITKIFHCNCIDMNIVG